MTYEEPVLWPIAVLSVVSDRCGVNPNQEQKGMTVTIRARITGGVDTHLNCHMAAALDERGGLLAVEPYYVTKICLLPSLACRFGTIATWRR